MTVNAQTSVGGYQYTWRSLVKGSNGSGFSTMLNIEYMTSVDEKSLKQSILFNCGDSTQQACLQAKLKLQKLTTIIITSLSPHNTSGLPGIIFCLPSLVRLSCSMLMLLFVILSVLIVYLGKPVRKNYRSCRFERNVRCHEL